MSRTLFEENPIDEIILNVHPVLLGSGIRLFPELSRQIDLELTAGKTFKDGLVVLSYRVRKA